MTGEVKTVAPALSVVVPLCNEEDCLPRLYQEVTAALTPTGVDYELVLVDDGSTLASPQALMMSGA